MGLALAGAMLLVSQSLANMESAAMLWSVSILCFQLFTLHRAFTMSDADLAATQLKIHQTVVLCAGPAVSFLTGILHVVLDSHGKRGRHLVFGINCVLSAGIGLAIWWRLATWDEMSFRIVTCVAAGCGQLVTSTDDSKLLRHHGHRVYAALGRPPPSPPPAPPGPSRETRVVQLSEHHGEELPDVEPDLESESPMPPKSPRSIASEKSVQEVDLQERAMISHQEAALRATQITPAGDAMTWITRLLERWTATDAEDASLVAASAASTTVTSPAATAAPRAATAAIAPAPPTTVTSPAATAVVKTRQDSPSLAATLAAAPPRFLP